MKVIQLHQEEAEIIRMAVEKNRHAQHHIFTLYSSKMLSVCRSYVKDLHQAEDVMITAFMKVFANLDRFEFKGSFEGWIRRIMVNECISFLRVNKTIQFTEEVYYTEAVTSNTVESQLTLDEIQVLIDALPNGYRMVFNLYVLEGYKHHEIAQILKISEGTSKSQLSHARRILQNQLKDLKEYGNGTGKI